MHTNQPLPPIKPKYTWIDWVGVLTLVIVTLFAFGMYPSDDMRRWPVLGLLLLSAFLQIWPPEGHPITVPRHQWHEHLRLGMLTLFSLIMVWLNINYTAMIILYFIYSGRALFVFPTRLGYLWVLLLGGITTVAMLFGLWPEWSAALLNGLGATCGFFFVGSAASAQRRAEEATAQLRVAHQQLQLYADSVEELATAEERNRLAREMHDTLGHRLTVAAVQLEGAQKLVTRNPEKATAMIGTVREQVLEGLAELRRTVAALRTPADTQESLGDALARLVADFGDATNIDVVLTLPASIPPLSTAHRQTLYRTAQEGLTNIQRHAQATQARLTLTLAPSLRTDQSDQLLLTVDDNGVGLPAPTAAVKQANGKTTPHGYGLQGIEERATHLGGMFTVGTSTALGGTSLQLFLPLAQQPITHQAL